MINQLTLRSFQAHRKLVLELDPRVTTIIGPSDRGKSAILRAIRWVALNQPTGDSFINWKAKSAKVTLETDTCKVTRGRGAACGNFYRLNGKELTAFGNHVPEEVQRSLNLTTVNFQNQHDSPFWFDLTGGEVSRQLNQIVNLSVMDDALSFLMSKVREHNSTARVVKSRLLVARQKRKELRGARDMAAEFAALEELETTAKATTKKLHKARERVEGMSRARVTAENARQAAKTGREVLALCDKMVTSRQQKDRLRHLIARVRECTQQATNQPPDMGELEKLREAATIVDRKRAKLNNMLAHLSVFKTSCKTKATELAELEKELHKLTKGKCPLCGKINQ